MKPVQNSVPTITPPNFRSFSYFRYVDPTSQPSITHVDELWCPYCNWTIRYFGIHNHRYASEERERHIEHCHPMEERY